jgi:hypothetical protein
MKESSRGGNSNRRYLIHCKNFGKYSNVSPSNTTIIKQFRKRKQTTK